MSNTTIAPGHWLRDDAARSYARMAAAGMPEAVINSAGRTYAEQVALFVARYSQVNTGRDYQRWDGKDWWRKNDGTPGYAAVPGTSAHESGLSLDLNDPARGWLVDHGEAHGWVRNIMPSEPWHFTYDPERDRHRNDPIPEDDMTDFDATFPIEGEAAKVLSRDEQSLKGALGYASASYVQGKRDAAKIIAEIRGVRKALGQAVDEKGIAAEVVALLDDDLQDAVKEALAGTSVNPDVIAKKTSDLLAQRLAS
jgi:hypothetical protein